MALDAARSPLAVIMAQMQAIVGHDTSARLGDDRGADARRSTAPRTRCSASPTASSIAALIPGARLELLEGVGHMFWWEQPERVAELVREHVAARGVRRGRQ